MYHVSAQGVDVRMMNVHYCYYYYYSSLGLCEFQIVKLHGLSSFNPLSFHTSVFCSARLDAVDAEIMVDNCVDNTDLSRIAFV